MAYFEFAQTDYECFEALVKFAYTSRLVLDYLFIEDDKFRLEIGSKKIAELYKTAFALQMEPVVGACASYLADHLNVKNCIGKAILKRKTIAMSHSSMLITVIGEYIFKIQ